MVEEEFLRQMERSMVCTWWLVIIGIIDLPLSILVNMIQNLGLTPDLIAVIPYWFLLPSKDLPYLFE